jgi:HEAT repeat protein
MSFPGRAAAAWVLWFGLQGSLARAGDLYGGGSDLSAELRGLLDSQDAEKRRLGIEQLAGMEPRTAAAHLLSLLRDPDASVRARAAHALGPGAFQDAASQLLACLSDSDSGVRSACAEALGQFGALPPGMTPQAAALLGRALGDSQYEVRMESLHAIERLLHAGVLGLPEAQHLLGPVLLRTEDEHVGVRRAAAAVLGRMAPLGLPADLLRRAVVALLGRLSDSARDVRAEALSSLAPISAVEAAPAALRLLQDPAEEVRRQALLYLGRVSYAAAVPLLIESFTSGPEALRPAAAQALGMVAGQAGEKGQPAITALSNGLVREELRPLSREALLEVGPAAVPVLLLRLQQGSPLQAEVGALVDLLRDLAAGANSSEKKPLPAALRKQVVDALSAELARGRLPREEIVDALAAQDDPSSSRLLVGLLSEPDVALRRHAVAALRQPGLLDVRALSALTAATRDSDHEVRLAATLLLAELPLDAVLPRLLELLRAPDPEMRLAATSALGEALKRGAQSGPAANPNGSVLPALLSALTLSGDGLAELRARRAAAQTLGQLVSTVPALRPQAISALLAMWKRGHTPEASLPEVVTALGNTLRDAPTGSLSKAQADAVRRTLLDLATTGADPDSNEAALALDAIDAIGAIRDAEAAPRLAKLLSHRDPLRRLHAAAALGNLASSGGNDSSLAALEAALKDDSDPRVVAEAAWALGKLPPGTPAATRAVAALRQLLKRREGAGGNDASGYADSEHGTYINALAALFRLRQAEVADAAWLSDGDPGVRANAALLLGTLPSLSAGMQARLRNLANTDEDHRVRSNAEWTLRSGAKTIPPASAGRGDGERRHFLTMFQLDADHKPLSESTYQLTLPDGVIRVGTTDRRGIAREERLPAGTCEVELLGDAAR